MGQTVKPPVSDVSREMPLVRSVDTDAPWRWLVAGWNDLARSGSPSFFYGACFAAAAWLMHVVFERAYALLAGLTTGFLFLGPFLAMGLYDLSRRMEQGEAPQLLPTLASWRPNIANVGVFAAVLAVVLLVWARASMVIFALFFDTGELPTFADVVRAFVAFEQPTFALAYCAVGGFFAAFVFAVSAVSLPLMLDRNTDAVTAAITSLNACARNTVPMMVWAICIAALTTVGFATLYVGLIVLMPLVGHASWHAYRDLVESASSPR